MRVFIYLLYSISRGERVVLCVARKKGYKYLIRYKFNIYQGGYMMRVFRKDILNATHTLEMSLSWTINIK